MADIELAETKAVAEAENKSIPETVEGNTLIPANGGSAVQEAAPENVLRRHIKEDPRKKLLAKHKLWMENLQHEYPLPFRPFKIGVYIRYYNQTRHSNYLEKHIAQFKDDISLCPNWTLVDFYIDKGMTAPRMENAKEWCRLLGDCFTGKVDLIVTQKVRNVSNDADEISFIARTLAAQKHPVGIYFISEDIFSLASYYRADLLDRAMLPQGHQALPDDELDIPMVYEDGDRQLSLLEATGSPDTVESTSTDDGKEELLLDISSPDASAAADRQKEEEILEEHGGLTDARDVKGTTA